MKTELSDEQIAYEVQHGKIDYFGILVERYEAKLKRYAKKFLFDVEDSEDLLQNVFIKTYINIRGFNTSRKFSPWIYRIAHNEFIDAIKRKGKEPIPFFDPDTLFPHPIARDNILRDLGDKELVEMLNAALDKLDSKYREPLVLFYFEGMEYEAIAEILQIPKSTVGVRLIRGKEILKNVYNTLNHE